MPITASPSSSAHWTKASTVGVVADMLVAVGDHGPRDDSTAVDQ